MHQEVQAQLQQWLNHLKNGSRIPKEMITVEASISDRRFFLQKKIVSQKELGAIVMLQIESLQNFLNIKNKLGPDQIGETAALILSEYDDLNFTAIEDCFNRIKLAKAPFNDTLYESIDGRKILTFLERYRNYQIEFLEQKRLDEKQLANSTEILQNDVFSSSISKISEQMKIDAVNRAIERDKAIAPRPKTPEEILMHGWIAEFNKENPQLQRPGALEEFLNQKLKEHLD